MAGLAVINFSTTNFYFFINIINNSAGVAEWLRRGLAKPVGVMPAWVRIPAPAWCFEVKVKNREVKRKLVHLLGVLTIPLSFFIDKAILALLSLAFSLFLFFLGSYIEAKKDIRKRVPFRIREIEAIEDQFHDFLLSLTRGRSEKYFSGAVIYLIGLAIALLVFPSPIAFVCVITLAVGDSLSTLVGVYFGKHKLPFNKKKSVEGSLAFFISTFVTSLLFVSPIFALVASIVGTIVEAAELKINDNVLIPVIVGLVLIGLMRIL